MPAQYTLRGVSAALDEVLRRQARAHGKSLNQVAIEMLTEAAGLGLQAIKRRDLSDVSGTWKSDPGFDRAIARQHRIDKNLWR